MRTGDVRRVVGSPLAVRRRARSPLGIVLVLATCLALLWAHSAYGSGHMDAHVGKGMGHHASASMCLSTADVSAAHPDALPAPAVQEAVCRAATQHERPTDRWVALPFVPSQRAGPIGLQVVRR